MTVIWNEKPIKAETINDLIVCQMVGYQERLKVKKKMATVRELLNTLINGEQSVLVDDNKGKFIPLQREFNVEDDTLFLFTEGDNESLTANQLKRIIECEAENTCWNNGYKESLFLDCEVVIGFGTSDANDSTCEYISTNAVYTGVNNALIIRCDDSNGTTDDLVADVINY